MKGPLLRQPPRHAEAIHALHPVEALGDGASLVGLDAADEVPVKLQVGKLVHFDLRLLQIVFAEIRDAGGGGEAHGFGSLSLGNCNQSDRFGVPPGGNGCITYPRPDVVHMKRQILRTN